MKITVFALVEHEDGMHESVTRCRATPARRRARGCLFLAETRELCATLQHVAVGAQVKVWVPETLTTFLGKL